jgi:PKHD-type hydroxylase
MLLEIANVLSADACAELRGQIREASLVDGRVSAGPQASRVKRNRELPATLAAKLSAEVLQPLHDHPQFQAAALPARLSSATIARYDAGMEYGYHTDDPIMGPPGGRYRSDIAVTVMLSAPDSFTGGGLAVHTPFGVQQVHLPEGAAVLYPASSLHAVLPVTDGARVVAVAWVQSMVRTAEQRQILFDLWRLREALQSTIPDAQVSAESDRVYTNLVRMWAEL